MAGPYSGMVQEVCVMLVDHDKKFINEMVDLLKSYDYKVKTFDMASAAMSMLSKGKEKIDVMIINVNSPDLLSFQLLAQAVALNIISLFVCDEHNELLAKRALDDGAYLYMKKPLHEEIVKYLWQFVLRERIQREKNGDQMEEDGEKNNVQSNNIPEANNDVVSNEKYKLRKMRGRKNTKEINKGESQSSSINKTVRRKACTEWTLDLHTKFMKVVELLGDGRCYPKEILEVMNVPGLTRMQVASHLQKCRSNNWRAPEMRKSIQHPSHQGSSSGSQPRNGFRKFGTMPRLQTNVPNLHQQQRNPDQTQRSSEFPFPKLNTNNIFDRGESSTQQQLYRSQLQLQPNYLNIGNPFNNPSLSAKNNVDGGLQQQYGSLFGMLGSERLQDPNIESTNYRPFNSGDHHTQYDYNLDLNEVHITTYSGTNIGNETINELGAANDNFQQYIGEQNISDPSNIIATSHDTEGTDSNYDSYFDFNNMDYLFQNLGPPSANLPNEYGSEFDQVYSDDQVEPTESVQYPGIINFPDESST